MQKAIIFFLHLFFFVQLANFQDTSITHNRFPTQYITLHRGTTLLDNVYPNIGISYSRTLIGKGVNQLAINPQFQLIRLPDVENKFLMSINLEYKLQTKWRLETNIYIGINYQLRRLAYDRYEYKDGSLKNIGNLRHQVGPTLGLQLGYKAFSRKAFSLSPFLGFSLTKLRNSYTHTFTDGFVPTAFLGLKFNIN